MARATFIGHLRCEAALAIRRHVLFELRRLPFGSMRSSISRLTCYFRQCSDESLTARKTANLTHASGRSWNLRVLIEGQRSYTDACGRQPGGLQNRLRGAVEASWVGSIRIHPRHVSELVTAKDDSQTCKRCLNRLRLSDRQRRSHMCSGGGIEGRDRCR